GAHSTAPPSVRRTPSGATPPRGRRRESAGATESGERGSTERHSRKSNSPTPPLSSVRPDGVKPRATPDLGPKAERMPPALLAAARQWLGLAYGKRDTTGA